MSDPIDTMANAFSDELRKIAMKPNTSKGGKVLPALVAGGLGWEALRRANEDRKIGRQVRKQQNPGIFG